MNNYPERMFFEEKIQEIETERDMLKGQVLDLDQVIKKLKAEKKDLRKMVLAGSPPYYKKWQESQTEKEKLREVAEALVEKVGKGILSLESQGIEGHNEALFWHNLICDLKQALEEDYGI